MKPPPKLTPDHKEWIRANSGNYTAKQIGDMFGCSQQVITSFVKCHNLPRKMQQIRTGKREIIESEFFNIDNYKNVII